MKGIYRKIYKHKHHSTFLVFHIQFSLLFLGSSRRVERLTKACCVEASVASIRSRRTMTRTTAEAPNVHMFLRRLRSLRRLMSLSLRRLLSLSLSLCHLQRLSLRHLSLRLLLSWRKWTLRFVYMKHRI